MTKIRSRLIPILH